MDETGLVLGLQVALRFDHDWNGRSILMSWPVLCEEALIVALLFFDLLHHILSFVIITVERDMLRSTRCIQILNRIDRVISHAHWWEPYRQLSAWSRVSFTCRSDCDILAHACSLHAETGSG